MTYEAHVSVAGADFVNLREQKEAETSARLLATARKCCFKKGNFATSMDELCADSGVTRESFIETCLAYLEAALDPEVRRIVFQDGPLVLGQRLSDIDQEGSVEP